jgi:hypothetical protein
LFSLVFFLMVCDSDGVVKSSARVLTVLFAL